MRELPRLPETASVDERLQIIYDWLYELQMEWNGGKSDAEDTTSSE